MSDQGFVDIRIFIPSVEDGEEDGGAGAIGGADGTVLASVEKIPTEADVPVPGAVDGIAVGAIRQLPARGILECGVRRLEVSTGEGAEVAGSYGLFWADGNTGCPFEPIIAQDYCQRPENMLNRFLQALRERRLCPRMILVSDEHTRALLAQAADMLGTKLELVEELLFIDEITGEVLGIETNNM